MLLVIICMYFLCYFIDKNQIWWADEVGIEEEERDEEPVDGDAVDERDEEDEDEEEDGINPNFNMVEFSYFFKTYYNEDWLCFTFVIAWIVEWDGPQRNWNVYRGFIVDPTSLRLRLVSFCFANVLLEKD